MDGFAEYVVARSIYLIYHIKEVISPHDLAIGGWEVKQPIIELELSVPQKWVPRDHFKPQVPNNRKAMKRRHRPLTMDITYYSEGGCSGETSFIRGRLCKL